MNRIDRLTAILIQLQTKRIVRAEEIAERFEISLRTVYRDVKALMEAGVPIGSEAGKGYFIVDGYHLPPVMFNQEEASALLTAGKLIEKMTDKSIRTAYESALLKIRSVLNASEKDHLENLQSSIAVFRLPDCRTEFPNEYMAGIQKAVSGRKVISIEYLSSHKQERTTRKVEPIGIVFYSARWHLIAWCRLRKDYRDFRVDRIEKMAVLDECDDRSKHLSLSKYLDSLQHDTDVVMVKALIHKDITRYIGDSKYQHGWVGEVERGNKVEMQFAAFSLDYIGRWFLMMGSNVEIVEPEPLIEKMKELVKELGVHYS